MPQNRLALIRYKTIDRCLNNRYRNWTLDDLIDACSDALYEFEGKKTKISKRTIQYDIQNMRSEKLGYEAPIVVVDRKYYKYSDPNYSITNMPLRENDIKSLKQITQLLKQFTGFRQFADMDETLKKIENKVFALNHPAQNVINFETNNNLRGLHFLDPLYDAILNKVVVKLVYMSFTSPKPIIIYLSPYLLKEYNSRWFVFGKREYSDSINPLALDRIVRIKQAGNKPFVENTTFDEEDYFKDIIGVTRYEERAIERVVFKVANLNAQYVITKPMHHSQQILAEMDDSTIFSIDVIPNYEMESRLLSFGEHLEVIEPKHIRENMKSRVSNMKKNYK